MMLHEDVKRLRSELAAGSVIAPSDTAAPSAVQLPVVPPLATSGRAPLAARDPAASAAPGPPSAAPPPARPTRPPVDIERLVGRYGTIGVATVAILLAVGAFLQWAIARRLLGPEVRVALGALLALALAATGMRVRRRGSRAFGNVLLALALAVVQVVAWAAGPSLHLVPETLALIFAAVSSVALAILALSEREQALFVVGLGGALLAPFVTSSGAGNVAALLVFGWIVTTAAITALRIPDWRFSRGLVTLGVLGYVLAAFGGLGHAAAIEQLRWPSLFALAVAISALVVGEPSGRRGLTLSLLTVMALSLFIGGDWSHGQWDTVALAFVGTLAVHALRRRAEVTTDGGADSMLDSVVLPLAFLLAGLLALTAPSSLDGAAVSGVWAALAGVLAFASPSSQRRWHLTVLFSALEIAVLLGAHDHRLVQVLSSAGLAMAITLVIGRERHRELVLPLAVALLAASVGGLEMLRARTIYSYTPFVTQASLAALGTVVAWVIASRVLPVALFGDRERAAEWSAHPDLALVRAAGAIAVFVWGRQELGRAYSTDISTFLLISYYAIAGVVSIGIGRARALPVLRHAGLALALYAAFKAVAEASGLAIGLRVGSYLVVGIFLLGVGYWYRATAAETQSAS